MRTGELCYASRGFSLHAATRIDADDREGLERLCRYVARPPLAAGSVDLRSDVPSVIAVQWQQAAILQ
ncbi:MAG: hypothetical protein GY854_23835 [Deltaproteobacteria bacterium]|nr:hypothetical protein [Deltaproteobacteria bacterium]